MIILHCSTWRACGRGHREKHSEMITASDRWMTSLALSPPVNLCIPCQCMYVYVCLCTLCMGLCALRECVCVYCINIYVCVFVHSMCVYQDV